MTKPFTESQRDILKDIRRTVNSNRLQALRVEALERENDALRSVIAKLMVVRLSESQRQPLSHHWTEDKARSL